MKLFRVFWGKKRRRIAPGKPDGNLCGGYRFQTVITSPVENIEGELSELFLNRSFENGKSVFSYDERTGILTLEKRMPGEETAICSRKLSDVDRARLTNFVKECGIAALNAWRVIINGLPETDDLDLQASFTSGEKISVAFNGGRKPDAMTDDICGLLPFLQALANS